MHIGAYELLYSEEIDNDLKIAHAQKIYPSKASNIE